MLRDFFSVPARRQAMKPQKSLRMSLGYIDKALETVDGFDRSVTLAYALRGVIYALDPETYDDHYRGVRNAALEAHRSDAGAAQATERSRDNHQ